MFEDIGSDDQIKRSIFKSLRHQIFASKTPVDLASRRIWKKMRRKIRWTFPRQLVGQRTSGRGFMNLQFPPFWIKFSNYQHQCPPTWNALAVDAFVLVTQPGAFNFKIDLALTNRAVTAITFSPQRLPCSAHLALQS